MQYSSRYLICFQYFFIRIIRISFFFIVFQEKQVEHLPMMRKSVSTPEGVDRLFDLVKIPEERMKLAFFAVLRNTVVANDLDQVSSTSLAENCFDYKFQICYTFIFNFCFLHRKTHFYN